MAWVLELWLALVVALAAVLWIWTGSEGSLATALQLAARALPQDQQLLTENVRGNLRAGGQITRLRWVRQGLSVEARKIEFRWDPWALLERRLVVDAFRAGELVVDDQGPARAEPLQDLLLPIQLDVHLTAGQLRWLAQPGLQADAVTAHYHYDGSRHSLVLHGARLAQGRYHGQASLLARAPLTLDLQLQGQVQVPLAERQITLDAKASLVGPLASKQGPLALVADLQPGPGNSALPASARSMRAHLSARINPWAAQPVQDAQAHYSQLDLAALWPGAVRTLLTGDARVRPEGTGWQAKVDLVNTLPGPWDRHLLPLTKGQSVITFVQGGWNIESLRAEVAGGKLELQGRLDTPGAAPGTTSWQGAAQLTAIDPAQLHSRFAPARLGGTMQAESNGRSLAFKVLLQPGGMQPAASALAGLRLKHASARGSWADGWLRLQELAVQTDDASLQGPLDVQPAQGSGHGQLQIDLPGARGRLAGVLAPQDGNAELALDVADAGRLANWLRRLPFWPVAEPWPELHGKADLLLHWQGGWQSLQATRSDTPRIQAMLQIPSLRIQTPGTADTDALHLQGARITLAGTPDALTLSARTDGALGGTRLVLQAEAQGGRVPAGDWRLTLNSLKIDVQDDPRPGAWTFALGAPMLFEWLADPAGGSLRSTPAQMQLTGPLPGVADLQLQAAEWRPGLRGKLSTQGQLRGLPMAWLARLGNMPMADLGLSGNLLFDASWELAASDSLRARATVWRRSGDMAA